MIKRIKRLESVLKMWIDVFFMIVFDSQMVEFEKSVCRPRHVLLRKLPNSFHFQTPQTVSSDMLRRCQMVSVSDLTLWEGLIQYDFVMFSQNPGLFCAFSATVATCTWQITT